MKSLRKFFVSLLLVFATGCSLLGGGSPEAKAKEGWEMIQARKGENYYESCEYYHIYNMGAINQIYVNNNVFDGKIFYVAYHEENEIWDYYKYTIDSKNLVSIEYNEFAGARQLARSEGVAYHGVLGKDAASN